MWYRGGVGTLWISGWEASKSLWVGRGAGADGNGTDSLRGGLPHSFRGFGGVGTRGVAKKWEPSWAHPTSSVSALS